MIFLFSQAENVVNKSLDSDITSSRLLENATNAVDTIYRDLQPQIRRARSVTSDLLSLNDVNNNKFDAIEK